MFELLGIHVSSGPPLFLAVLAVHIPSAMVAVVSGIVAMLSKKQAGRHPNFGAIYYWCLLLVFVSATILSLIRWTEDYYLFILGAASFTAATIGRTARQRRWRGWVRLHIAGMGLSYIVMLTAFYVDNGKSLPLWKDLPSISYWLIPSIIGLPLIIRALWQHPLVRRPEGTILSPSD